MFRLIWVDQMKKQLTLMVFLTLMGISNKVYASLEQYFCVPTGWISASTNLEFDASSTAREFMEHIYRGTGDGRGFLL